MKGFNNIAISNVKNMPPKRRWHGGAVELYNIKYIQQYRQYPVHAFNNSKNFSSQIH